MLIDPHRFFRVFGWFIYFALLVVAGAVLIGCTSPTEVWRPCDVPVPPSYCAGVPAK